MKKVMLFVGLMLVLVAPCFAVDPLGAPRNYLEKGQFSAGISSSYTRQDLEVESYSWSTNFANLRISDFQTTKVYFEGAYAPSDKWSIFGRVGTSEGQMGSTSEDDWYPLFSHLGDGDYKPSFGAGVRFTVAENGDVSWGGIAQIGYTSVDFDNVGFEQYWCLNPNIQGQMNLFTGQLVFGPTLRINENASIYCGAFLNYLTGDMDIEYRNVYSDSQTAKLGVDGHSPVGVYAGGLFDIKGVKVAVDGHLLLSGGQGLTGSIVIPIH